MTDANTSANQRILLLNRDLMSGVAIANAAGQLGYRVERIATEQDLIDRLTTVPGTYALVILDMNLPLDFEPIAGLIDSGAELPPIIGFGPHVDIEGRREAKQAGLTRILSNGDFKRDMSTFITRYARGAPDPRIGTGAE